METYFVSQSRLLSSFQKDVTELVEYEEMIYNEIYGGYNYIRSSSSSIVFNLYVFKDNVLDTVKQYYSSFTNKSMSSTITVYDFDYNGEELKVPTATVTV